MPQGHTLIIDHLHDIGQPASAIDISRKLNITTTFASQALRDLERQDIVEIESESSGPAYHKFKLT